VGQIAGHVFISYVREDALHADRLQRALEAAGLRVWRDTANLWPGEDWREKIRREITTDSLVFVACFSQNSISRRVSYQNEELRLAIEELQMRRPDSRWLIPVRFDDCEIPGLAIGGGRTLDAIQRVDLFGDRYEENLARLVAAISASLKPGLDADRSQWSVPPPAPEPYASRKTVDEIVGFFGEGPGGRHTGPPGQGAPSLIAQLTGEPGLGKTYIALRAAEQLRSVFTGGVFYANRPRRSPDPMSFRPGGRVLLIADDAEGLSPESLRKLALDGCDLLVVSRTVIRDLGGPVFMAAALTPDGIRQFVSELLAGQSELLPAEDRIADLSQGSPLLAFLLVEEAKRRPHDLDRLGAEAVTVPRFLEISYQRLSDPDKTLLRRLPLLRPEETIDTDAAAMLLGTGPAVAGSALETVRVLFGESRTRLDRAVRDFAVTRLNDEEPEQIPSLHARVRQWRAARYGVPPRARLTRDYWTTKDLLGYRAYADAISAFIRHPDTLPPLTIGVKGPWGAGKTSLMRMVQGELDPEDREGRRRPIELTRESRLALRRRWGGQPSPGDRLTMGELLGQANEVADPAGLRAEVVGGGQPAPEWRPTVWFNPWMYQSGEQVWAGLAAEIIAQVADRLAPGDRERFWARLNLSRLDGEVVRQSIYKLVLGRLVPLALSLVLLAATAVPFLLSGLLPLAAAFGGGSLYLAAASVFQLVRFAHTSASSAFSQLLSGPAAGSIPQEVSAAITDSLTDPGYRAKAGFLRLVQADMGHILGLVATPRRPLVVFVDDLDRCSPGTVTEVIEAINLFLAGEFPNCMFILAMEPDLLAAHVEVAYKDLVAALKEGHDQSGWETLGWRFLDKIVQLPLGLPPVGDEKYLDDYVRDLLDVRAPAASPGSGDARRTVPPAPSGTGKTAATPAQDDTASAASGPGPGDAPRTDLHLVDQLERGIRLRDPNLDNLPDIGAEVQEESTGSANPLLDETVAAIDRVFSDLYSDAAAWTAVRSVLPQLGSSNPRELKRYLNLFRFYSFIVYRRRLDGIAPPTAQQVAKIAALAIRWPQLLTALSASREGVKILGRLEAAAPNAEDWQDELEHAQLAGGDYSDLRQFLSSDDPIAEAATLLI
jgi:hypothetical protein